VAIDDLASESALQRLEIEDLQRAPALAASAPAIVLKALVALACGDLTQAADLFTQCQGGLESERSRYLLRNVIEDLKWLHGGLDKLTQQQQEYMSTNWVELLFDADKKARATRAKTRIARIAKILCSSIQIEPTPPADQTEEMMRIATELTDDDVVVLRQLRGAFENYSHLPPHATHSLVVPVVPGVPPDSVLGICGKLQSLGLIATVEQHAKALKRGAYPPGGGFVPLDRAETFLRFIADTDRSP
jgi:hypothetical protein